MISTEYSHPQIQVISANTISEKRREEKREESVNKFLSLGVGSAAFGLGAYYALKNDSVNSFFNSSVMDATIKESANGRAWNSLFSDDRATVGKSLLEGVRKVEELSPFRIFRTLQLSHLLTPYSTGKDSAVDISPDLIRSQERYFSSLLKNRGEMNLSPDHLRYGLRLENGRLFEKNASGEIGAVVAKEARLMFPYFALPKDDGNKELVYANKILKQYSTHIGAGETDVFNKLIHSSTDPFMVIAARSKSEMNFDLAISYFRNVFAQGAKILDRPFDFITEFLPTEEGSDWHNRLRKWSYVGAGTGGKYRQSIGKSLQMMVSNNIKLLSAASSYYTFDYVSKEIAPEDSSFSEGLLKGVATTAVNAHLAFSEMWSDNFQGYKEAQEFYAPGSTSLMTMAGAPLALGTAGATASYLTRLYQNAKLGIERSEINAEEVSDVFPEKIKRFLPKKISEVKGSRGKRWGLLGFSAGLLLEAPFIPGALIGEDSETLKRQYSGEEDVAIRKNRWWFSSSNKYGGDSIKYFDKSAYSRLMADTNTISRYGDSDTEDSLNPILHPFDYLRDPYQFEKMNSESRPYPVWGMDISTGSFIGKFFEKTIGAIIKPDIINPRLAEELVDLPQGTISHEGRIATSKSIASAIDSGTFAMKTDVSEGDASLIEEGKLIAPAAATYEPISEATSWSWEAFKDFVGLKGWIFGEMEEAMDIPSQQIAPQLARSGEITNAAKAVRDMNLGGFWGLCFTGDTNIKTRKGYRKIEDIEIGELVYSIDGKLKPVISKVCHPNHNKKILEVSVSTVHSVFKTSDNHWVPFLKVERYKCGHAKPIKDIEIIDTQVKNLSIGDYLVYPIIQENNITDHIDLLIDQDGYSENHIYRKGTSQESIDCFTILDINPLTRIELRNVGVNDLVAKECLHSFRNNRTLRFKRYLEVSDDILWFLGWYTAEGHSEVDGYRSGLTLHEDEINIARELQIILSEINISSRISNCKNSKAISLRWSSPVLNAWLKKTFGDRAKNKIMPAWIKELPKERLVHYISGLCTGDGWSRGFTSSSRDLVIDTFDCLLKIGIKSNIKLDYYETGRGLMPQGTKRKDSIRSYLDIFSEHVEHYKEVLDRSLPEVNNEIGGKSFIYDGKYFSKIRSIKELDINVPVFDLEIEDYHYYIVERTCVHNTEPQRRYIPTSASVTYDRINPLKNNMPTWIPGPEDSYFIDFQKGDPYGKIEHGASRLPGRGFESLNKEMRGVDPEDYPDIFKMKILSDVAMGSSSYYGVKNSIEKREGDGTLTSYEYSMLGEIRKKEFLRSEKRQFSEYKGDDELEGSSLLQLAASKYWETGSHGLEKSLPSEFLTFFRPAGKLIHQRSSIEDYERTQFEGSDMAIWTKPISHFIKPALVSARRIVDTEFESDEVKERRQIDRYFDTLEYVKQRRIYKEANISGDSKSAMKARVAFQKTTEGALASGIDTDQEMLRSYISLPDREKAYFSSFVNAETEDREKIKNMTPDRVSDLYNTIWTRKDIMDKAVANGATAEQANQEVQKRIQKEDSYLAEEYNEEYKKWISSKESEKSSFREHLADIEAEEYIERTTGMPGEDFSGWDPRIDMKKIKLRALTIGGEDFFKYGFWKDDVKDLQRYSSVNEDLNIRNISENMKKQIEEEMMVQDRMDKALSDEGYRVRRITTSRGDGSIDINMETLSE